MSKFFTVEDWGDEPKLQKDQDIRNRGKQRQDREKVRQSRLKKKSKARRVGLED